MSRRHPQDEMTPYDTRFGVGWIRHRASVVVELRLPAAAPLLTPPQSSPPDIVDLARVLSHYFAGRGPLPPAGDLVARAGTTPLLRSIYEVVAGIAPGTTMTYRMVAEAAGRPGAARVVGAAMAANPFAPVIPCHRVVGSDGTLRGYGGGLEMKQAMLDMERGVLPLDL
jgi:methylated-DNA-[protein]-cysteine S-methyltransferase